MKWLAPPHKLLTVRTLPSSASSRHGRCAPAILAGFTAHLSSARLSIIMKLLCSLIVSAAAAWTCVIGQDLPTGQSWKDWSSVLNVPAPPVWQQNISFTELLGEVSVAGNLGAKVNLKGLNIYSLLDFGV